MNLFFTAFLSAATHLLELPYAAVATLPSAGDTVAGGRIEMERGMGWMTMLSAAVAVALLVYLVFALIDAENL